VLLFGTFRDDNGRKVQNTITAEGRSHKILFYPNLLVIFVISVLGKIFDVFRSKCGTSRDLSSEITKLVQSNFLEEKANMVGTIAEASEDELGSLSWWRRLL
jgi:hypothetical protein